MKLPALHLVDSIIKNSLKNIRKNYLILFSRNIINTFCNVFQESDEKIRSRLWKLRQCWNGVFEQVVLYHLDVSVQLLDPAWPLSSSFQPSMVSLLTSKFL